MLTSKQRAFLRSMANGLEPIFHIGKAGVTPELTEAVDSALEAREILKMNILDNCLLDTREAAQTIAARTHSCGTGYREQICALQTGKKADNRTSEG